MVVLLVVMVVALVVFVVMVMVMVAGLVVVVIRTEVKEKENLNGCLLVTNQLPRTAKQDHLHFFQSASSNVHFLFAPIFILHFHVLHVLPLHQGHWWDAHMMMGDQI